MCVAAAVLKLLKVLEVLNLKGCCRMCRALLAAQDAGIDKLRVGCVLSDVRAAVVQKLQVASCSRCGHAARTCRWRTMAGHVLPLVADWNSMSETTLHPEAARMPKSSPPSHAPMQSPGSRGQSRDSIQHVCQ